MKRWLQVLSTIAIPALACAQHEQAVLPEPTHDWGCEVLLCLANPDGQTAVHECEPPIHKLWRHLAHGGDFPSCSMASGPNGRSYARPATSRYDPCPEGTQAMAQGALAELSGPMQGCAPASPSGAGTSYEPASTGVTYRGIGEDFIGGIDTEWPTKVCVGGQRGTREVGAHDDSCSVAMYDTVFGAPAQGSSRAIDVYVDDRFWQRVRW